MTIDLNTLTQCVQRHGMGWHFYWDFVCLPLGSDVSHNGTGTKSRCRRQRQASRGALLGSPLVQLLHGGETGSLRPRGGPTSRASPFAFVLIALASGSELSRSACVVRSKMRQSGFVCHVHQSPRQGAGVEVVVVVQVWCCDRLLGLLAL